MSTGGNQLSARPNSLQLDTAFTALLEAVPDAAVIVNSEKRIELANETAAALFGYSKGELPGKPAETLLPQRFRTADASNYFTPPPSGSTGKPSDLFGLRKDGREFPLEIIGRPLQIEGGHVSRVLVPPHGKHHEKAHFAGEAIRDLFVARNEKTEKAEKAEPKS